VIEERATTPGGLPYPLSSDPVAGGAAAIQALAEAVDGRLVQTVTRISDAPLVDGAIAAVLMPNQGLALLVFDAAAGLWRSAPFFAASGGTGNIVGWTAGILRHYVRADDLAAAGLTVQAFGIWEGYDVSNDQNGSNGRFVGYWSPAPPWASNGVGIAETHFGGMAYGGHAGGTIGWTDIPMGAGAVYGAVDWQAATLDGNNHAGAFVISGELRYSARAGAADLLPDELPPEHVIEPR
jgi:hypothetical protein